VSGALAAPPVLVPAMLTEMRTVEVGHLSDFAEWAGLFADYYGYLAEDYGARAAKLEWYVLDMPPGFERDRLEARAQTYRDREELNMLRAILALEWYGKISTCSSVLLAMPTE
jgi:hypothetical protein